MDAKGLATLLAVMLVAALAPMVVAALRSPKIPQVVVLILAALAEIGQHDGVMLPSNAAAIVGAGVVSVLLFPAIATVLRRTGSSRPEAVAEAVPVAAAEDDRSPA